MRKLTILMITSLFVISMASPIFAKDVVEKPSGGYQSTHAHHGQGQQLGGKSGDKSSKGLRKASERSKGAVSTKDSTQK
jgi:hypothetical protein